MVARLAEVVLARKPRHRLNVQARPAVTAGHFLWWVVTWYCRVHGMTNTTVSAPKMTDVVCAQNFFRRKGTKSILQVTVPASYRKAA
jgi:hypothetical protein